MSLKINWSGADAGIGWSQIAAWSDPELPSQQFTQVDPGAMARSQIYLISQADECVRAAQLRVLLTTGALTLDDYNSMMAGPMPADQFGAWADVAQSLQKAHGSSLGQIGDLYLAICHFIRRTYGTARRTDAVSGTPELTVPPGELPQIPPIPGLPTGLPTTLPTELPSTPPAGWPSYLPWPGGTSETTDAPVWAIAIVVFGVASIAGLTYYGIEKDRAGVKIAAESAVAQFQSQTQIAIARAKIQAGQFVELPEFMSRAAQIEKVQSSPIFLIGSGIGLAAIAGAAVYMGSKRKPRRANPTRRLPAPRRSSTQRRVISGATVEVRKLRSGYKAYLIGPTRNVPIAIGEVSSYAAAFSAAGRKIRSVKAKRKKAPARRKKATTRRKTTTRRKKTTRREKTTRRKKAPARRKNPARKKVTRRKGKTESRYAGLKGTGPKAKFLRSQKSKGRSPKQAAAAWKLSRAAKKKR
jgi:hypothetical protein